VNAGKLLFAQLMDFLPWTSFARSVSRYGGDRRVRNLSCAEQFRAMAFAQLTYRESRVCAISKHVSAHNRPSSTPWGSARSYDVPLWPKPTRAATGASMLSWRKG